MGLTVDLNACNTGHQTVILRGFHLGDPVFSLAVLHAVDALSFLIGGKAAVGKSNKGNVAVFIGHRCLERILLFLRVLLRSVKRELRAAQLFVAVCLDKQITARVNRRRFGIDIIGGVAADYVSVGEL